MDFVVIINCHTLNRFSQLSNPLAKISSKVDKPMTTGSMKKLIKGVTITKKRNANNAILCIWNMGAQALIS